MIYLWKMMRSCPSYPILYGLNFFLFYFRKEWVLTMMMKTQSIIPSQQKNPYITIKVGNLDKQFFLQKSNLARKEDQLWSSTWRCPWWASSVTWWWSPQYERRSRCWLKPSTWSSSTSASLTWPTVWWWSQEREVKIINISVSQLTAHHVLKLTKQKLSN